MTDQELEALLLNPEADWAERKENLPSNKDKICQAICAFANDLARRGKGVLFIGAKDDGSPSGITVDDQLLLTLGGIPKEGKILPAPMLKVEKRHLAGAEMAVVTVLPTHYPPVRYEGRIWVRVGPRRSQANDGEERQLEERRLSLNLPYELAPIPMAGMEELDRLVFEQQYLPSAVAQDVLAANHRTYEQRLSSLKFVRAASDPVPTVLGLLVIGKGPVDWVPGAYVQFVRVAGTQWGDPIADQQEIHGSLPQLMARLDDLLRAQISIRTDITSQRREIQEPSYPIAALEQLLRNAVMHRDYGGSNAPVRISWYDDRIEIQNPGGPFGQVTPENFGQPGVTDYRNPNLAAVLKEMGYVQRFGVGITTARRLLRESGHPDLEFLVQAGHVQAIIRRKP